MKSSELNGQYEEIHSYNREVTEGYNHKLFSFVRWSENEHLLIVANFDGTQSYNFEMSVPESIIQSWNLKDGDYTLTDQLYGEFSTKLVFGDGIGKLTLEIAPNVSFILQ